MSLVMCQCQPCIGLIIGNRLGGSGQSLDLNLIENICDELDNRIKGWRNHPKTWKELACIFQGEWKKIPLSILQTLRENMSRRVKGIITSVGGSTNYEYE
ncbi:hypothetical protein TNCV_3923851 [Trichonephila clavipes]|nr:hypothetical protein TNCV_3923851 [Trichonephila clavipes]